MTTLALDAPKALIGMLTYVDGSFMPAIVLDCSDNPEREERILGLYKRGYFDNFSLKFEDSLVSVYSGKKFLDGCEATWLSTKFTPDNLDDISGFLGLVEVSKSWNFILRLSDRDIHFLVIYDTGKVINQLVTSHKFYLKSLGEKPCQH